MVDWYYTHDFDSRFKRKRNMGKGMVLRAMGNKKAFRSCSCFIFPKKGENKEEEEEERTTTTEELCILE